MKRLQVVADAIKLFAFALFLALMLKLAVGP